MTAVPNAEAPAPGPGPRALPAGVAGLDDLVVFDNGRWFLTSPGGTDPVRIDPGEVRRRFCTMPAAERATDEPVDDGLVVTFAQPALLAVRGGSLCAWSHDEGRQSVLDAVDVELLSARFPVRVDRLREGRFDQLDARLRRLLQLGILAVGDDAATESTTTAGDPAAPDDGSTGIRSGARTAATRRAVTRLKRVLAGWGGNRPGSGVLRPGSGPPESGVRSASRAGLGGSGLPRVFAAWDIGTWGQPLALGGLMAYARVHRGGALADVYDLRRLCTHDEMLRALRTRTDPAIVLFSDYIWSAEDNLRCAAEVKRLSADHLVVHGGPHVPGHPARVREHFERHPYVDVLAHGEGEITLAEFLTVLDGNPARREALVDVAGLSVRLGDRIVRTADRPRHDRLEDFPSPYLSGEFDHLDPSGWQWPSIETDRGCPYSCTFCDWGSATRSRIRTFPIGRVEGELRWLAEHRLVHWMINDANFGIHERDVRIAEYVAELRREFGVPNALYVNYAKNTVKHLTKIIRILTEAGVTGEGALALQTRDAATLEAIKRRNIRVETYDQLAEEFRRLGLPLVTDLIIGLPGQTVSSFLSDIQYCIDQDITPRFFVSLSLPNAEMNEPEYRRRFGIVLGEGDVVVESTTFSRSDRDHMMRLRMAHRAFEHLGMLRHVLRYLQWDHGVPAAEALDRVQRRVHGDPGRYPLMSWVLGYLDLFLIEPHSWSAFYEEAAELCEAEFGLTRDPPFETVLTVQQAVMPHRGRTFPASFRLPHDYVAWFAARARAGNGTADGAEPLVSHPPGEFVVRGDPLDRCGHGLLRLAEERPPELLAGPFWTYWHWELDSDLQRLVPETSVVRARDNVPYREQSGAVACADVVS